MRKLLCFFVIVSLLVVSIPFGGEISSLVRSATPNKKATMIFAKFNPVGYDYDGEKLEGDRNFPWERKGTSYWGRFLRGDPTNSFLMPYVPRARDIAGNPEPVQLPGIGASWPMYWAEIYLEIDAKGGESQEYIKWYAVLDDAGQLWLDPDGQFHDPRYDERADSYSARYTPGNCTDNPMSRMDPIRSNNTQGPYVLNPRHPDFEQKIYFWDRNTQFKAGTDRVWRVGWVNMPDYIREGGIKNDGTISNGRVNANDCEVQTTMWDPFSYKERNLTEFGTVLYEGIPVFNPVQPHIVNLYSFSSDYMFYDANGNGIYDSDEYIYRKNTDIPNTIPEVEVGDFRYTPVSVRDGDRVYNYPASDRIEVIAGDKDLKLELTSFTGTPDFQIRFADNNLPNSSYDVGEYIYRDYAPFGRVNVGDIRLTNVYIGGSYLRESGIFSFAEIISRGDVLCLLEVLEASCDNLKYDISVETDVWEGINPSTTAARFRSPNKDITESSSRIQKNTVLDPVGDKFAVPAATFNDIDVKYRSYIGVQIFRDNGVDNNRGLNLAEDKAIPYSLSDDYKPQRVCEEFLGAIDGSRGVPDVGEALTPFPLYVMYHDTGGSGFGCGESIYLKHDKNTTNLIIEAGDTRLTEVTVHRGDNITTYSIGSIVAEGDFDIGLALTPFSDNDPSTFDYYKFFDELVFNRLDTSDPSELFVQNGEYDPNEMIYYDANDNSMVDIGDIRLSEGHQAGVFFECGSRIEFSAEYYFNQPIPHMITVGANGDPRYIDIEVIPGNLSLNVQADPPLKVEQTSTVKVSLGREPALGEKIYISAKDPKPGMMEEAGAKKLFDDALLDPGEYTGITPGMVDATANAYFYRGNNSYVQVNLWGAGPDGFKIGDQIYDRIYITEDGMASLYRGYPQYPAPYYPYEYVYDYQDSYGYWYGGRPYPFSASSQYGGYAYPEGYWYKYPPGSYMQCYKPWQDIIVRNTWVIPLGGQWHIPVQSLSSYPAYYRALPGWGIFYERTNEYLRVVWRVVTYPFTASNSWYHGYNNVPRPGVIPNTSEFEMVIYRAGIISFNYKDIRIPTGYLYFRNNDVPGDDPTTRCQWGAWRYKPMIAVSEYYTGMHQLSRYSYGGTNEIPNGAWLNDKSIVWKSPEPPDEGLYAKKEFNVTKVIDRDNPIAEFQYTPYRGSCVDGNHGNDGFRAGTTMFNQFEIRAFVERGGVKVPVPLDSDYTGRFDTNYRDPFWRRSRFNKSEWQENYRKEPFFIIPPEPSPPLPDFLRNAYDCYAWIRLDIAPEELIIKPSKACIDLVSSRSPNISYTVFDADNPADVNDPANVEVKFQRWFAGNSNQPDELGNYDYGIDMDKTGSYGHPLVMNFNAHGAGIEYLFTAQSGYGQKWQRYIVQVNSDGTYEFWRWFEGDLPGQVFGALDPNDMLYTIRGYYIPYGGQWDPVSGGQSSYKVPDSWRLSAQFLEDMDCSVGLSGCLICGDEFPPIGNITGNDRYGLFGSAGLRDNPSTDPSANIPYISGSAVPSAIITYGVPVVITSPESNFSGGMGLGVANPKNADTPLKIRLYSTTAIYDYNSLIKHPPSFVYDEGPGIDYCGYTTLRVLPEDPVLNFAEMTIVDRSLQTSRENYTAGDSAWAPLPPPNPQIMSHYDPILHDWSDMRSYPGGQTHTGRTTTVADRAQPPRVRATSTPQPRGLNSSSELKPQTKQNEVYTDRMLAADSSTTVKKGYGRNAYPALFRDMFHKLGTEFFPMTDYGLFFILRDPEKNHYTFDPQVLPESLILKRVTIKGPFMLPKMYSEPDSKIDTSYNFEGLENVPIQYDTSGEIVIDANNAALWEVNGIDYNMVINPLRSIPIPLVTGGYSSGTYSYAGDKNKYARYTHSLYYGGSDATYGLFFEGDTPMGSQTPNGQSQYWFSSTYYTGSYFYDPTARYWMGSPTNDVYVPNPYYNYDCRIFAIDELIPTGPGKIEITVETGAGVTKIYQDCCQEQITDGITTEGLEINNQTKEFLVDADNTLELTLNEYDKKGDEDISTYCNDAVLVAWQDRGAIDPNTGRLIGSGDGWITNPPRSSDYTNIGTQYLPSDDLNGNGKVSFNDWETEIVGSYDLATNTWSSGIIDARTFHRNNGKYRMEFTENNGSRIDTIGIDFGGLNARQRGIVTYPDGVIGDDEVLPIILNAYKYGDDNNDRGFTPFYNLPGEYPQYSHEVYLTGRVEIPIRSQNIYSVSYTPDPLTAGVQPELQDPTEPLTIFVNDETGAPVDLLAEAKKLRVKAGIKEEDVDPIALEKAIWNALIKDPHPEPLPQYYWLRTDLHNDDETVIGNTLLYSNDMGKFSPIDFDISGSKEGKYTFKGFTANDAGSFDLYVYSPDRRNMGKVAVKVQLPSVTYKVSNYDDSAKREFSVPGDPDFLLTAGDNMIYKIHVAVKDAQGRPLKGIGQTVSICGGSAQEVSRFTPFITTHKNFYRCIEPWYWHFYGTGKGAWIRDYYYNGQYSWYDISPDYWGDRWHTHMGVDLDGDGVLEPTNNELERVRPMVYVLFYVTYYGYAGYFRTLGETYYNTECVKYDDGTFATKLMFDANAGLNPYPGWGIGCIYNRPYYTEGNYGMVFANLDKFGDDNYSMKWVSVSNTDSLNLNVDGETEFYVFGEDVCEVGGLVGKNSWSASPWGDVVGSPAMFKPTSPNSVKTRFGRKIVLPSYYRGREAYYSPKDWSYKLDWDAMPSNVVKIMPPKVELLNAEDLAPLGKSLFNEDLYDLVYGKENHIKFNFYPADKRDIPLKGDITMVLAGNEHEYRVSGRVDPTGKNPGDSAETTMFITPTGTGLTSISLDLTVKNLRKDMMRWEVYRLREPKLPDDYFILDLARFDVAKGLYISLASISGPLTLNSRATLKVVVEEIGSHAPVKGAEVTISGAGVKASGKTDENGLYYFDVTPQSKEALIVTAKKDGYISGKAVMDIGMSSGRKDIVKFNEIPLKTRNPEFELRGEVSEEAVKILVNDSPVKINEDRTFKATIILKEGFNTIVVSVEDIDGRTIRKIITIELKTKGPILIIDEAPFSKKLFDVKEITLTGKIDPKSTLVVNGVQAEITGNSFEVTIPTVNGVNTIIFKATDELGNITQESKEIYVYTKRRVELIVGSKTVRIDDKEITLTEPPFISSGRTYVPLRLISEAFGAEVNWNNETKGITITKRDVKIDMVIGSNKALVNDRVIELSSPPIIRGGITFVPVRFVSEVLGGEVTWNERIKLILIEFLI